MADDRFPRPVLRTRLYEQVAEQITGWIAENGLGAGDRLPPERELAVRLGVSRATLSQALVALEVIGVVVVRHGDGTVLTDRAGAGAVIDAIRAHADRLPEIIEARDALESKLAALAAVRRTDADLAAIRAALEEMERDIAAGGRGVEGDELFHGAVTRAARSELLAQMMAALEDLIKETRLESLSQPGRPRESLAGHRRVADAIVAADPRAAAQAMHEHVMLVSDVALLRETGAAPGGERGDAVSGRVPGDPSREQS
ncbi:FadR/GntR family transcriptional regulator [Kribbella sp. CA-293567]|uniref:FadR/GntR family transcriptional regulator n=1 Tax=Kribbella sp. CA-293567 TaxID=3002436 RepID=UPI0022DCE92C|nr:FadR/GntR family transcriptional regulator [Kribbella sp. CA-293567]WBQ03670.1 FadR/GntR family transcriptional regulator [Kribbella sp. CA-293567]